jgi:hypothetical protein
VADAAFATGADQVEIGGSATNITIESVCVQLTAVDLQDAVRGAMTALPNAAAGANNGLPLGDASGRVTIIPADGISDVVIRKMLLAIMAGKISPVDNGNGTHTYAFKAQDGSTTVLSVTVNDTTAARTATGTPS